MANLDNAKIYKKISKTGAVADQYAVVNLDATNFCVTLNNQTISLADRFDNINNWVVWKRDAEGHVTVTTPYASTDAANKGYVDDNYVSLTRSETIQGLKTFERRPRVTVGAVQYTYLQSQGYNVLGTSCPYIDTGIKLTATQNMLVEYDIEVTSNEAAFVAGIDGATGVGSNGSNYWYLGTSASTSSVNTHTRQTIYELIRITSTTKRAAILNSSLTEIGARTGTSIATYAMNTTYPIFAIKNNSDTVLQNNSKHSAGAKIYSVKIYVGAPENASELRTSAYLVAEYIPAKLGENNGFYDNLNHYFITSSNVYAFDIGEEVGPIDSSYENVALMSDLPAVGEGTLIIQRNETYVGQFNANTVADATINIEVPTSINELSGWSTIGTTSVSTKTISTSSVSIASGNTDLVTGGAIYSYVENEGGKVKSVKVNGTTYNPEAGVITLPNYPVIPTNVSAFTNDAGYLTQHQAIPSIKSATLSWGTAVEYGNNVSGTSVKLTMPAKPSYTAGDVGALPSTTAFLAAISKSSNTYTITKSDNTTVSWTIPTIPSNVSAFNNDVGYLTTVSWSDVTNKPTTFAPSAHSHSLSEITDVSTIGTTAVSTKTISTSSVSIASGNSDLVTGGAIYNYVENEGGKIKEIQINGTTQTISAGVVNLPAYPSVSNSTITIKQTGIDDQTFTLNGSAVTITLADTNTWRPLGTGATDAAAGNHTHNAYVNQNAYGNIKVGSTTTTAGSTTDTITFAAGGDLGVSISGKTITYSITLPTELPASDVSAWAKAANKPTYTASEVGALPSTTTYLKSISKSGSTYTITNSANGTTTWTIPTVPTNVSSFTNDAGYLTTVAWGDVTGKPSTFAPTVHTHSVADITGVSTIGTTAVSTVVISSSSADIAAGNSKIVTGGAIADALANVSYKPTVSNNTLIFH